MRPFYEDAPLGIIRKADTDELLGGFPDARGVLGAGERRPELLLRGDAAVRFGPYNS